MEEPLGGHHDVASLLPSHMGSSWGAMTEKSYHQPSLNPGIPTATSLSSGVNVVFGLAVCFGMVCSLAKECGQELSGVSDHLIVCS